MIRALVVFLLIGQATFCQDASPLPEKLKSLKSNYEAAVARATAPLTKSYLQELQRLKLDYTRAGNLQAALAADALIKAASDPASALPVANAADVALASMNVEQFKGWLSTVVIREVSGFKNQFTYDGRQFVSTKAGSAPRVHDNVLISVGKIFVPFTSTNATILIDPSRSKAEITYSTGQKIEARIELKTKG